MAMSRASASNAFLSQETVRIPSGPVVLKGWLELPLAAGGLVVFIGAAGSSRLAVNDVFAARRFHASGLGTLFVDLLTSDEELHTVLRYDVALLAERLKNVTGWLRGFGPASRLRHGYYGTAGGAAAALRASADSGLAVAAVVCRGGRPDLAAEALPFVHAPTLLLVGERDEVTFDLNRQAIGSLRTEKRLLAIPNAGPFFDEPGTLEEATRLAASWFVVYLSECA